MDFQETVRRRKMVRSFEDRPVPHDQVERMLANARRAPSAGFSQGWAFLVLEGKEETFRFWDACWPVEGRAAWKWPDLFNAPVLIFPLADKGHYLRRYAEPDKGWTDLDEKRWRVPYWDVDAGMAALLVLLTAVDAGLGALFFGITRIDEFHAALGVPREMSPVGAIAVGYPKVGDRPSPSLARGHRPAADIVHRGRW